MKTKINSALLQHLLFQSVIKKVIHKNCILQTLKNRFTVSLYLFIALIFPTIKASAFVTTICDNIGTLQKPVWSCMVLVNVPCSQVSYIPGMTCSEQYFAIPPKIKMLPNGPAVLDNNGQIMRIGSNKIIELLNQKQSMPPEEMKVKLHYLLKNDIGKVSKDIIDGLAKELGAEVIIVDKLPTANYCPTCSEINNKGNASMQLATTPSFLISIAGGYTKPLTGTKSNFLANGFNIQADAFIPFYKKTWNNNNYFLFGINAGVNYVGLKNSSPNNEVVSNNYQVYNTTNSVSSATTGSSSSNLSGLLGLQAAFGMNKFYISPVLSTGYSGFTLQGYTQTATYTANGQSKQKELVQREKQNFNGFVFKPQLRMGYNLSSTLSLFTNVAYTFGPEINASTNTLIPQGGFNSSNYYEPQQIQNGSWQASNSSTKYKALEVNFGITIHIIAGKLKGKVAKPGDDSMATETEEGKRTYTGEGSKTENIAKQSQDSSFGEKVDDDPLAKEAPKTKVKCSCGKDIYAKDEAACKRICQFLKDGTYLNGVAVFTATELQQLKDDLGTDNLEEFQKLNSPSNEKSISSKGVKRTESTVVEPTTDKSIDTKGVKSNKTDVSAMVIPGNPIGGIIVKGSKNSGGENTFNTITDENGEVTFIISEVGEYKIQLSSPESISITNTSSGSGATSSSYASAGKMATPSSEKSINLKGVKSVQASVNPGNPIGGVIVKGGKILGEENTINAISNENGEFTFMITEAGEYKIQILSTTSKIQAGSIIKATAPAATELLRKTKKKKQTTKTGATGKATLQDFH